MPDTAMALLSEHTLVVEGADNLATKFLVADAAHLAGVPAVQAGAVRWAGWALCALPGSACLRCLFEDIPRDRIETCAEAGVVGPVVGVLGGLQAALVFRLLAGTNARAASFGTMTRSGARFARRSCVAEATARCAQERFRTYGWSGTRRLALHDRSSHLLGLRKERTWLLRYAFQPHSEP